MHDVSTLPSGRRLRQLLIVVVAVVTMGVAAACGSSSPASSPTTTVANATTTAPALPPPTTAPAPSSALGGAVKGRVQPTSDIETDLNNAQAGLAKADQDLVDGPKVAASDPNG